MKMLQRSAFTLLELLVCVAIVAILLMLFLPVQRNAREAARRMACSNNLKSLGLALVNYHAVYQSYPSATYYFPGGNPVDVTLSNEHRFSGLVYLLPFTEQQPLWDHIISASASGLPDQEDWNTNPWSSTVPFWQTSVPAFLCPSAPTDFPHSGTNYAFSIGDLVSGIHSGVLRRGMFAPGIFSQDSMITDGLSNTIAMTEMGAIGQRSVLGQVAIRQPADLLRSPAKHKFLLDERNSKLFRDGVELADYRRGWRWADGRSGVALVNTVLPPNNASFAMGVGLGADGIFTAASHHTKIVNVLRGDGSVSPVSETIDCGSPQVVLPSNAEMLENPSLSPLGVWGALGTAASEDVVESP